MVPFHYEHFLRCRKRNTYFSLHRQWETVKTDGLTEKHTTHSDILNFRTGKLTLLSLDHDGFRFILYCSFEERHTAQKAGFQWHANLKKWVTQNPSVAAAYIHCANDRAAEKIKSALIEKTPYMLPLPPPAAPYNYMDHHPAAVRFALERNRSYLALDPGLGKTFVAAMTFKGAYLSGEVSAVLYICPPFLVTTVRAEMKKFIPEISDRVFVIPDTRITDENFRQNIAARFDRNKTMLVVDEAHRFGRLGTQRTTAVFGGSLQKKENGKTTTTVYKFPMVSLAGRRVMMSGTPVTNRPLELFPVLNSEAPEVIGFRNYFEYGRHFCNGHQKHVSRSRKIWDFSGHSNIEELWEALPVYMIRQKKHLLNLPPVIENQILIDGATQSLTLIDMEVKAEKEIDTGGTHVMRYRHQLGLEKIPFAKLYIQSLIEGDGEKIIAFAYHRQVIAQLKNAFPAAYVVDGDTSVATRFELVEKFQNDKSARLLIGNYVSMGVGFTITAASRVVFVEYDWVPGVNEQAYGRAHRIGQQNTVIVDYLAFAESLDQRVLKLNLEKREVML